MNRVEDSIVGGAIDNAEIKGLALEGEPLQVLEAPEPALFEETVPENILPEELSTKELLPDEFSGDDFPEDEDWMEMALPKLMVVGQIEVPETLKAALDEGYFALEHILPEGTWLDAIKAGAPEVLFLVPGPTLEDTCTLAQEILADADLGDMPILLLTAEALSEEDAAALLDLGLSDYLHTGVAPRLFLSKIQAAQRQKITIGKSKALAKQLNDDLTVFFDRNKEVEKELNTTRQLQQSLLPRILPDKDKPKDDNDFSKLHYINERIRISGIYIPCDSLGGDLYDIIPFQDGTVGVTIADVSGHGVPAAFVTAIFKAAFYRMTNTYQTPGDILYHLNNELYHIVKTGEYVTCIYCRLKDDGRTFEYTGAGHPYPMHYRAKDGTLDRLKENGTPLVWLKDMDYPMGEVPLEPGDKLLIFTDGISEIKEPNREFLGEPALEEMFLKLVQSGTNRLLDDLMVLLSEYTQGHPLEDDMSMVLIEVL